MQLLNGRQSYRLDVETESGREPDGAKHAQVIFLEALFGVADRADDVVSEILKTTHIIHDFGIQSSGIQQQCVDGEVSTQHVSLGIGLEGHFRRMPAVLIRMIAPEGRNLDVIHEYHAELSAHQLSLWK